MLEQKAISELPPSVAGKEADLYPVVQGSGTKKQTLTKFREAIVSAWSGPIKALIASTTVGQAKGALGLDQVDNTPDLEKPISAAQQSALDEKASLDDLASEGATKVGFTQVGEGAAARTVQDKLLEHVTPQDFSAAGDGATDDSANFANLEAEYAGVEVDLLGKTYLVTELPTANLYYGGFFKVGAVTYSADKKRIRDGAGIVAFGGGGAALPANYDMGPNQFGYRHSVLAAGSGALAAAIRARQTIAIGPDTLASAVDSFDNFAAGECALYSLLPETSEYSTVLVGGTRNIAIGGNAGRSLVSGRANVLFGRNTGASLVASDSVLAVGANALAGEVFNGWYPQVENFDPNTNANTQIAVVGGDAAKSFTGIVLTATGYRAGYYLKKGNNNALFGMGAGRLLESLSGLGGKVRSDYPSDPYVTYTKVGSIITVNAPGHAAVVGGLASIYWATGGPAYAGHGHAFPVRVLSVSGDTFTVSCPYAGDGTGNARLYWTTSLADAPVSANNQISGSQAAYSATTGNGGAINGAYALQNVTTFSNVTAIGYNVGQNLTKGVDSLVIIGSNALRNNTGNVGASTAVGHNAGLLMVDGSVPTMDLPNCGYFGSNARNSGPNQIQLGDSATSVYTHGPIQNRSDARDKTDIQDTELGLDFILGLRPVSGIWDLRDDYIETYEEQDGTDADGAPIMVTRVRILPMDGSKKRTRRHQWFIAQEVQALCERLGVEFGGLQHHAVNGGGDGYSPGYEEFIPPLTRAVQQIPERLVPL